MSHKPINPSIYLDPPTTVFRPDFLRREINITRRVSRNVLCPAGSRSKQACEARSTAETVKIYLTGYQSSLQFAFVLHHL